MAENDGERQEMLDRLFENGAMLDGQALLAGGITLVQQAGREYLSASLAVAQRDILIPFNTLEERDGVLIVDAGEDTERQLSSRLSQPHRETILRASEVR